MRQAYDYWQDQPGSCPRAKIRRSITASQRLASQSWKHSEGSVMYFCNHSETREPFGFCFDTRHSNRYSAGFLEASTRILPTLHQRFGSKLQTMRCYKGLPAGRAVPQARSTPRRQTSQEQTGLASGLEIRLLTENRDKLPICVRNRGAVKQLGRTHMIVWRTTDTLLQRKHGTENARINTSDRPQRVGNDGFSPDYWAC